MDLLARTACGFAIALICSPAGVSGAFLLLPTQLYVFGAPSPVVSATNLVYNVVATPAGALSFERRGRLDRRLALGLIVGTAPGVVVGVVLRSTWLSSARAFAWVAGAVMLVIGARLVVVGIKRRRGHLVQATTDPSMVRLAVIGTLGGAIGGVYGFGGAALVVPWLVSVERLPIERVAGAGLVTTFVTSIIGLAAFVIASQTGFGQAQAPQWTAGLAFGIGGALGSIAGARLQPHIPVRLLQLTLGMLSVAVGVRTLIGG